MKNPYAPAMMMCAALWGMMTLSPEAMAEYMKPVKKKPVKWYNLGPSKMTSPKSRLKRITRRVVTIEEVGDGTL